jgi:hypothetical protein
MVKIKLGEIKHYLDTELLIVSTSGHKTFLSAGDMMYHMHYGFKPYMYRLSDLDKMIPELGFVPVEELKKLGWSNNHIGLIINGAYTHASFNIIQKLFEWNFWVFNQSYFYEGIIIDKLTVK